MRRLRDILTVMIFSIAFVLTVAPFHAAEAQGRRDEFCRDYADEAVEQNEINERRRCGFSGPRWSNFEEAHYAWCSFAPREAEAEKRIRADLLRQCAADEDDEDDRPGPGDPGRVNEGKRASCDTYASMAVAQAEANEKYGCRYRGGEWSLNTRGHFDWCLRNKREFLIDEMRYRAVELQKCFNRLGDYDDDGWDRGYRRRF
ncbi:MAG: hypothetical protein NW215_11770 [Hyphomicrobiales bacterium]|nr:hypothetical protein [Hyphomicrobiales bacterium]